MISRSAAQDQAAASLAAGGQEAAELIRRAAAEESRLLAAIAVPYVIGFIFIINEEIFTGMKVNTMHPPSG